MGPRRLLITALAVLSVVGLLVVWRYQPPAPRAHSATGFSAAHARATLERLLSAEAPHPVGSAENAALRARLLAELRSAGLEPEVQSGAACGWGSCAPVHNVLARIPGRQPGSVLLVAHYDSVPAGPGASDDGAGMATVVEVARSLAAEAPLERPLVVLIDDGEEAGLLGMRAFVREHRWAKGVHAAVNMEARGTTGPSLMFETSGDDAWLVDALADLRRPVSSSLFTAVYRELPNDTDLSVLRRAGLAGVNFAFIGGAARYHTPVDDLAHLDDGSLQQHGDNALGATRALVRAPARAAGDAVFFDVLALGLVAWPMTWTLPLVVLGTLLWVAAAARSLTARTTRAGALFAALPQLPASLAMAALLGLLVGGLLEATGASAALWPAEPLAIRLAVLLAGATGVSAAAVFAPRRVPPGAAWLGISAWWCVLAWLSVFLLPKASYLAIVPLLAWAGTGVLSTRPAFAALAGLAAAALLGGPVLWMLHDAVGVFSVPLLAAVAALLLTPLGPAVPARAWRVPAVAGVALLIAAGVASAQPPFSTASPQKLNLVYVQGDGQPSWLAEAPRGELPPTLAAAAPFAEASAHPWTGGWSSRAWRAPARDAKLAAPSLKVVSRSGTGAGRQLELELTSERGAEWLGLYVPASVGAAVRYHGLDAEPRLRGSYRVYGFVAPDGSARCTLTLSSPGDVEVLLVDRTPGLPSTRILDARPAWAAAYQSGDASVVAARLHL